MLVATVSGGGGQRTTIGVFGLLLVGNSAPREQPKQYDGQPYCECQGRPPSQYVALATFLTFRLDHTSSGTILAELWFSQAHLRDEGSHRQNVLRWRTRMVMLRSKNEIEGMKWADRTLA